MAIYILRRLLQLIPLTIGITLISFGVMKLAPGDFLTSMALNPQVRPATIDRLRHDFGLDKAWYVQYWLWIRNAFHGNFGYSFAYHVPVFELIGQFALATLLLALTTMVFSWAIGIPLGVYAARHRNGFVDRMVSIIAFSGVSMPGFFLALLAPSGRRRRDGFPLAA